MPRREINNSNPEHIKIIDIKTGEYAEAPTIPYVCLAIRQYRNELGIEQKELAARLGVNKNAVSNWERGRSRPDFNLIPALCRELSVTPYDLLGISAPQQLYTMREDKLIAKYRKLSSSVKAHVDVMMDSLLQMQDEETVPELFEIEFRPVRLAAGPDAGLHDITEAEKRYVHESPYLQRANAIYKVNGDSMEPTFHDGELVYVEDIPNGAPLHFGEIGVFTVGSETYIKEYQQDGLHSHNRNYDVMHFDGEAATVYLIGRVLGVVDQSQIASSEEIRRYLQSKKNEE